MHPKSFIHGYTPPDLNKQFSRKQYFLNTALNIQKNSTIEILMKLKNKHNKEFSIGVFQNKKSIAIAIVYP